MKHTCLTNLEKIQQSHMNEFILKRCNSGVNTMRMQEEKVNHKQNKAKSYSVQTLWHIWHHSVPDSGGKQDVDIYLHVNQQSGYLIFGLLKPEQNVRGQFLILNFFKKTMVFWFKCSVDNKITLVQINGLVQDCSNSIALTMELLQSCTNPSR